MRVDARAASDLFRIEELWFTFNSQPQNRSAPAPQLGSRWVKLLDFLRNRSSMIKRAAVIKGTEEVLPRAPPTLLAQLDDVSSIIICCSSKFFYKW
jgi:hypothetical protein